MQTPLMAADEHIDGLLPNHFVVGRARRAERHLEAPRRGTCLELHPCLLAKRRVSHELLSRTACRLEPQPEMLSDSRN